MKTAANNSRYLKASKLHFACLIILISLLFFRTVTAQDTTRHLGDGSRRVNNRSVPSKLVATQTDSTGKHEYSKSYWFDLGRGWGGQGRAFDMGFSYEVAPQRVMSIRYSNVRTLERFREYFLFFPTANYPSGKDAAALEITYGVFTKGQGGMINFSAGLSLVKIKNGTSQGPPTNYDIIIASSNLPDDYRLEKSTTVGLVMRAQFTPSLHWGGIGISPSVNINPEYTFASMTIHVALGKMREKVRKQKVNPS